MQAVLQLKARIPDIHLDLVGGDGNREQEVLALAEKHPDSFQYRGKIYDKPALQQVYAENRVFAMPSLHETFGLVYVEALTQGLSLLYTCNEGVDGLFEEPVGEAVTPTNEKEIVDALYKLLTEPQNYQAPVAEELKKFDWEKIATIYQQIYHVIGHLSHL